MPKRAKKFPSTVFKNPVHFLAFGMGSGISPVAPGTVGTLAALPVFCVLQYLPLINYLLFVLTAFVLGCYLCGQTSRDLGVHDHGGIVWHEWVGLWITFIMAPFTWYWVLAGFVLFRFFDIVKPWPIRWCDRHLEGGFGIMFEDVLAGIFALLSLQALIHLSGLWL